MDHHEPLEHSVETVPPPIALAPGTAPSSVPDQAEPMPGIFTIGQWVPTTPEGVTPGHAHDQVAMSDAGAALGATAQAGADLLGRNAAMAQRMLAVGAEMTSHMNACARAHLDLVARSNADLLGAALRASTDLSMWTRRYLDVFASDRMSAFMRHRTPQHLALLQAEAFHSGVEAMLGWARTAAERAAAERAAVEARAAARRGADRNAA